MNNICDHFQVIQQIISICVFSEISLDDIPNKAVVAAMTMDAAYDVELANPDSPQHTTMTDSLTGAVCIWKQR